MIKRLLKILSWLGVAITITQVGNRLLEQDRRIDLQERALRGCQFDTSRLITQVERLESVTPRLRLEYGDDARSNV